MTDAPLTPPEKSSESEAQLPATSRPQPGNAPVAVAPGRAESRQFAFDGGAGTYIGTGLLAFIITVFTLGICYPFAFVLRERWRAKHSYIDGRQLVFTGTAIGLFAMWLKWFLLIIVTLGIYLLWVGPRLYRWRWENTSWAVS